MPGEMLAGRGHTCRAHATNKCSRQLCGALRIPLESAATNHGTALMIQIQHRRKAQIQPHRQYFGGHQPATVLGQDVGIGVIGNGAHRRQSYKTLTQTLHPPTLLIDSQEQIRTYRTNGGRHLSYLPRVLDIAPEQDQASHFGLTENLPILCSQPGAGDIQHQRALHE